MSDYDICPVCGVKAKDGNFYFSYNPKKAVTPSEVYTKVCRRAKNSQGCINSSTTYDANLDYLEATDTPTSPSDE